MKKKLVCKWFWKTTKNGTKEICLATSTSGSLPIATLWLLWLGTSTALIRSWLLLCHIEVVPWKHYPRLLLAWTRCAKESGCQWIETIRLPYDATVMTLRRHNLRPHLPCLCYVQLSAHESRHISNIISPRPSVNQAIISPDNGLLHVRHHAIVWINPSLWPAWQRVVYAPVKFELTYTKFHLKKMYFHSFRITRASSQ